MSVQVKWRGDTRANISGSGALLSPKELVVDTDNWQLGISDGTITHMLRRQPTVYTGTGPFALTDSYNDAIILADTSTGPVSVTLPALPMALGNITPPSIEIWIKDATGHAGTNAITITASGGLTIDGASSVVISSAYGEATIRGIAPPSPATAIWCA
ncbi:MAG TPA: hypothetical protein VKS60_14465 [Stellaceae bacterium]|nr:hypothetical protein [Stellaceae bacterium]